MSDMGELFNAIRAEKKELRARLGVNCPMCNKLQPKRTPTILVPGQRCKVDGYVDPRNRNGKQ